MHYILMPGENWISNRELQAWDIKRNKNMRSHLETNKITILWVLNPLVWSQTQLGKREPISYLYHL